MKKIKLFVFLIVIIGAVACAAPSEGDTAVTTSTNNNADVARLSDGSDDGLPVMTQLAVGTLQLDGTELAVDESLAATILPLWQVVQEISFSDTAASVEVTAVLNQIQEAMSPSQIEAIADMGLTTDALTELVESGAVAFGRGAGGRPGQNGEGGEGFTPPSGERGGNGRPSGGPGGGLSEDAIATRQAQIASGEGLGEIQDQAMVGAVIRLLQIKTGEVGVELNGGAIE